MIRFLLFFAFFWPFAGFALYNGNPAEPSLIDKGFLFLGNALFGFKMGYQGDLVFNRKLHALDGASGNIQTFRYYSNEGVLTLNIIDRFEFYGSAGAMQAKIGYRPPGDSQKRSFETDSHFLWGVGGRGILLQWKEVILGLDAKYRYSLPPIKWSSFAGQKSHPGIKLHYEEWQIGAGLSGRVGFFVPYMAVMFAEVLGKMDHIPPSVLPKKSFALHNRDNWGLALGGEVCAGGLFDLALELRLFGETALTLAANIKW